MSRTNSVFYGGSLKPSNRPVKYVPRPSALSLPTSISHVRILAFETSTTSGSVAVLEGKRVVYETLLPPDQRSARSLAPALAAALAEAGWRAQDIQLVAVTQGPGSFTGLRIGAATAKTLAYALGAQVVGVNTLEVIAAQAPVACGSVWTLLDAHRGQLFAARYRLRASELPEEIVRTGACDIDAWLAGYAPQDFVAGPGVVRVAKRLPAGAAVVDPALGAPRAATVGQLALRHFIQGQRDDLWSFAPHYYRASAAEEKYAAGSPETRRP